MDETSDDIVRVDNSKEEENDGSIDEEDTTALIWDGGPPIPPDPDVVIHDVSCQGTVAMALQEALKELQQHETTKSWQEKYQFQLDSQEIMRAFGESIVQQQYFQYEAQCDDAVQQQQLLQQQRLRLRQPQKMNNKYATKYRGTTTSSGDTESIVAPAAMLRGRMNHYNRYGTKWRMVVDDVEIRPRRPVEGQLLRRMKRDRTMSLWSIMAPPQLPNVNSSTNANASDELFQPIKIPRLEILIYNDIE